ncbi:MAG: DUF7388 family protein [Candidatus Baldrarchaeia archaeon]
MSVKEASLKSLNYVFFDFEWPQYNLSIEEFNKILEISETLPNKAKIIITIASRSKNFDVSNETGKSTVNKLLDIILSYVDRSGLNIVAGNPAYLSETEKSKNASKTLTLLGEYIASRINTKLDVFIGTEKILKTAVKLAARFNFKPFLLFSNSIEAETRYISKTIGNIEKACYVPFSTILSEDDLIKKTWRYVLRRKYAKDASISANINLKELEKHFRQGNAEKLPSETKRAFMKIIREFVVYENGNELKQSLNRLINQGITTIVGLPLSGSISEITTLVSWKNCSKPDTAK